MKLRSNFIQAVILLVVLFAVPGVGYAQRLSGQALQSAQGPVLCVTSAPNAASFPYVSLNFRLLDQNYLPIRPAETDLRISENGQTSVPLEGSIQDGGEVGIDYYVIVDVGNRTPQDYVRSILQTFANSGYVNEATDTIKVYTDQENGAYLYYPGGRSGNTFSEAASGYPLYGDLTYRSVNASLDTVLSQIETNPDICQKTRVIIMLMGDDALLMGGVDSFANRIKTSLAKTMVLHLAGKYQSRDIYESLAQKTGGVYWQIKSVEDDVKPELLDSFKVYKQVYSAKYRTNSGEAGSHSISAIYQTANIPIKGQASYTVDILPPTVLLEGEPVINRAATAQTQDGNILYDQDSSTYTFRVNWGDSYPREIKGAALVWNENGQETQIDVPLDSVGDNAYQVTWNFAAINVPGEHYLSLKIKLVDEFGNDAYSAPLSVTIINNDEPIQPPKWYERTEVLVLGSVVIVLIILVIIMWRKIGVLAKQGGAALAKIGGEIRKTLVGGGKKGKPLASLKVLDGPPTIIGQELKIYTESIKLGRNPQLADMTFYGPDVNTSISGLHARLEKLSGYWRIVALSQSGSETFLDDQPIPFNEPVRINSGQKVRLGYFTQQPVVFEFSTEASEVRKTAVEPVASADDPRKTDVYKGDDADQTQGFYGPGNHKTPQATPRSSDNDDSVFNEWR